MNSFQPLQPAAANGAGLAALFGSDDAASISLQFKAPRAPRAASIMKAPSQDPASSLPSEATGANPGIAFAGTCHVFRFYQGGFQVCYLCFVCVIVHVDVCLYECVFSFV